MLTKSDLPKRRPSKEGELQSLLSHVSQVFKRKIYKQITNYMENKIHNWIQKITWNAAFLNNHFRNMEKCLR